MRAVAGALILSLVACTPTTDATSTTRVPGSTTTPTSVSTFPAATTTEPAPSAWVELAPMAVARSEHPAAVIEGEVVIMGGFVEIGLGQSGVTASVEAYDPDLDAWRDLAELPEPRHHGMAAVVDDRLFMIGGFDAPGDPAETVWELVDGQWVDRAPLPNPVGAAGTAVLDGAIHIVGGVPDSALYRYDPAQDGWTVLPRPTEEREHVAAVALDGAVWAIAGRWTGEIRNSTESFDPATETWTPGPSLNEARSGFGAAAVGDRVVAVGGEVFSPDEALGTVELYDPAAGEWSLIDPLPYGLHGNPLVTIGTDVYLPGGSSQPAGVENDGRMYRLSLG
ncbi:MAG: Kelch repeat-containing protein [Acidimicrobiia bacterium]